MGWGVGVGAMSKGTLPPHNGSALRSKHKRFKRTLFKRTKHYMRISEFPSTGYENGITPSKPDKWLTHLSSSLSFFFPRHLTVVEVSFCSLVKGITPKILTLCFVPINSVLLNLLCVWFLF